MTSAKAPKKSRATGEPANRSLLNEQPFLIKQHLRFGWWTLLLFLTFGLVLEGLHGFKLGLYLKVSNEPRRLMWTLAHAHGTLLGLINLGFAWIVQWLPESAARERGIASICLRGATGLIPGGFFIGGLYIHSGQPGLGIILMAIGGLLLLAFLIACGLGHLRAGLPGADTDGATNGRPG